MGTGNWLIRCGGVLWVGLVFVLGIQLSAVGALRMEKKKAPVSSQSEAAEDGDGAPLPAGPGVPIELDNTKLTYKWLSRVLLAHYPADKDPSGAAFIKMELDVTTPQPKRVRAARGIDIDKVNDAGMLLMIGLAEPGASVRARQAFEKALAQFPQSVYPKFLWYVAAAYVDNDWNRKAKGKERQALDDVAMEYLNYGLNDDSFEPAEMPVLRIYIDKAHFQGLLVRRQKAVTDLVDAGWAVQPWVKDYVNGLSHVNEAWKARGNKVAAQVTDDGWEGFAKALSEARESLVKSWTEYPKDPAAATAMITVCMGEMGQTDGMRTWFDRAVAAQFDFIPAYKALEWGLYPRWGGSYEEMNALAEECGATGRYDTLVPNERVAIALDISEDSNDHGKQFKDPKTADGMLKVLDGYFATQRPIIRVRYSNTVAAIVADKAGKHDAAVKYLASIRYNPVPNKGLAKLENVKKAASDAKAKAGGVSSQPEMQSPASDEDDDGDEAMPDGTP